MSTNVQKWHSRIRLRILSCRRMREMHREPEVPEERVPVVECVDGLARITLEELAITHFVKSDTLQNACSTRPRVVVGLGKSALMHIARLMNSPANGPKRMMTKVHQPCWRSMSCMIEQGNPLFPVSLVTRKATDLLGAVHRVHDNWVASFRTWSRRSCHQSYGSVQTCRSQSNVWEFTKAIARHTKIRDQNPSLGLICPGELHHRSPNAPKFEDRSQEETEWQEQGAREAAWKQTTFFSPSENWCLPAILKKPEERELLSTPSVNAHDQQKGLELCWNGYLDEIVLSPTIVITANGEVQTHEEAIVYVKVFDIFLTMKVLQNTPAVLSLGKLCDENGCSYEWINGLKPHLIKNGIRIQCNTENFVPIVVPGLSASSSSSSHPSTSMTHWQENDHPTSSSSSSAPPTRTAQATVRLKQGIWVE